MQPIEDIDITTNVRAVLPDMDGTLIDSDAAVERAWVRWALEYGIDPSAVLAVAAGPAMRAPGPRASR
jgi:sugar-phosphatase